jgi:hypothetical protein
MIPEKFLMDRARPAARNSTVRQRAWLIARYVIATDASRASVQNSPVV